MSKDNKNAFLAQYGTLKHIEESLKSDDGEIRYYVCKNPLLPIHHMETIVNDKNAWGDHLGLSENQSAPSHILYKLSKHKDPEVQINAALHKNADPNSIDYLLNKTNTQPSVTNAIIEKSPHVTKEQLTHISNNPLDYHGYTVQQAEKRLEKGDYSND